MDRLTVVSAINIARHGRDRHGYSETLYHCIVFLYDNDTWEEVFRYASASTQKYRRGPWMVGKTRRQCIELLEKAYYSGKLEGKFLDC